AQVHRDRAGREGGAWPRRRGPGRGPGRRAPRGGWRGRDSTRPGSTGGRSCGAAGRRGVFPPGSACRAAPPAGPRSRRGTPRPRGGGGGGGRGAQPGGGGGGGGGGGEDAVA